jgi:hypothetical protein
MLYILSLMKCDTCCPSTIMHGDMPQKVTNLIFQGNKNLEFFDEERNM